MLSGVAWACSCAGYDSEKAEYRAVADNAKVVYTGLVTEETPPPPPPPGQPVGPGETRYTVQVEEDIKGGAGGVREVTTSGDSASCGTTLQTRKRALVVEHAGNQRTGLCDGTTQDRVDARAAIVRDQVRRNGSAGPGTPIGEGDGPSLPRTGLPTGVATMAAMALAGSAAVALRAARPA